MSLVEIVFVTLLIVQFSDVADVRAKQRATQPTIMCLLYFEEKLLLCGIK